MEAYILTTTGERIPVSPKNGTDFSLAECMDVVDGYIEVVDLRNGQIMIVNEEGKFTCPENPSATEIAMEHNALYGGDYISGDVLVCDTDMLK